MLANTSETSAAGSNHGTTITTTISTTISTSSARNQSGTIGGKGAGSANITPRAVGTDVPGSE